MLDDLKEEVSRIIKHRDSIFKPNWEKYLDFEYIPPNPKHRKEEIKEICIRIIDSVRQKITRNVLIYGGPGSGKTMSFKIAMNLANEILKEEGYNKFKIVYVRAAGSSVSQVMYDICTNLGINVPKRGISFKEYFTIIEDLIKMGYYIHVCVDEFDNLLGDSKKYYEPLLYYLTRTTGISATLITNKIDLAREITDARIISSLDTLNTIYFKTYTKEQCQDILSDRITMAFQEGFITDEALEVLATYVAEEGGDIRKGLSVLRFCGNYAEKKGLSRIDANEMYDIIQKHDILKDGEILISTLPISDKIVLAAIYTLLIENASDKVESKDVFAKQDYYRNILSLPSINRVSFSVYLTRLSTAGIIEIRKIGRGRRKGVDVYVTLRYPRDAVKYMIFNDPELSKLRNIVQSEIENRKKIRFLIS